MSRSPNGAARTGRAQSFPYVPARTWRHARLALLAAAAGVLVGLAGYT